MKFLPLPGMDVETEGSHSFSSQDVYMRDVSPEGEDQGWVSWAWSFIPAIVAEEGEDGLYQQREIGGNPNSPQQNMTRDPIVSIGLYCTKASITFKVNLLKTNKSSWNLSVFVPCSVLDCAF